MFYKRHSLGLIGKESGQKFSWGRCPLPPRGKKGIELSRLPTLLSPLPYALNSMMEQPIIWNTYAKIISGEYEGWYAQFVDDSEGETGGAYVLISQTMGEEGEAYDDWLEHASDVKDYIREVNWVLEYID